MQDRADRLRAADNRAFGYVDAKRAFIRSVRFPDVGAGPDHVLAFRLEAARDLLFWERALLGESDLGHWNFENACKRLEEL